MNATELQALRRLFFFSTLEAATLVAASPDRPAGVNERAWKHWEAGAREVPADVAKRMRMLFNWRTVAIGTMNDAVEDAQDAAGGSASALALCWYTALDDWASLPGREPILWRPQCSVLAEIVGEHSQARLVPFDGPAYRVWLASRADSEKMRGAWAATIT